MYKIFRFKQVIGRSRDCNSGFSLVAIFWHNIWSLSGQQTWRIHPVNSLMWKLAEPFYCRWWLDLTSNQEKYIVVLHPPLIANIFLFQLRVLNVKVSFSVWLFLKFSVVSYKISNCSREWLRLWKTATTRVATTIIDSSKQIVVVFNSSAACFYSWWVPKISSIELQGEWLFFIVWRILLKWQILCFFH